MIFTGSFYKRTGIAEKAQVFNIYHHEITATTLKKHPGSLKPFGITDSVQLRVPNLFLYIFKTDSCFLWKPEKSTSSLKSGADQAGTG